MAVVERSQAQNEQLALVQRMARGDEVAATEVYLEHSGALFRFVRRRLTGTIEDAEEIANDTFLSALDMAHTYDGSCPVLTWLCSLAHHRIADFRRRAGAAKRIPEERLVRIDDESKKLLRSIHDPAVSVEEIVEHMDRVRIVQALLDTLTPEQREAVTMRYVEGFAVADIAQVMGRSEKAVERLLERAKEKPRREMLQWLGEESFRMVCLSLLTL